MLFKRAAIAHLRSMAPIHLWLLIKLLLLSIVLSLGIKYLAPLLAPAPSLPLVIGLLLAPSGIMAVLLGSQLRSLDLPPR
ncbi:MAG: hypothetical protein VKO01_08160 [Cyanobacteriota bacterium]|nr:hypothetical protein [Cyanobacteriota bacterium]